MWLEKEAEVGARVPRSRAAGESYLLQQCPDGLGVLSASINLTLLRLSRSSILLPLLDPGPGHKPKGVSLGGVYEPAWTCGWVSLWKDKQREMCTHVSHVLAR